MQIFIGEHVRWQSGGGNPPTIKQYESITKPRGQRDFVQHDNHGFTCICTRAQDVHHLQLVVRVELGDRLIR